jgi:hypothetical protein
LVVMKMIILVATAALVLLHQPASPASKAIKLEGMEYLKARRVILGHGWRPSAGSCRGPDVSARTCATYPEVGICSGLGNGPCGMTFVRRSRCLLLSTIGGAPQAKPGDTVIVDVTFRPAPCPKEQTPD